eukprot:CAMPEP_0171994062 /NCGR_PEP_ID=MMETSP0993-20121228/278764_1 /TAXON_ID=483369 /ORGANISM="non described non described, Strain CCMP2098" /LENGTH=200 /DNA_ID=CAMNT_0012647131 /DNA_START=280 /DNA_END=883 /DNA_ORIENTATION=+
MQRFGSSAQETGPSGLGTASPLSSGLLIVAATKSLSPSQAAPFDPGALRGLILASSTPPLPTAPATTYTAAVAAAAAATDVDCGPNISFPLLPPSSPSPSSSASSSFPDLPYFGLDVECGGGTYVRSLIADAAEKAGSAAHMVWLERTGNGPFGLGHCLPPELWTFDAICANTVHCTAIAEEHSRAFAEEALTDASGDEE